MAKGKRATSGVKGAVAGAAKTGVGSVLGKLLGPVGIGLDAWALLANRSAAAEVRERPVVGADRLMRAETERRRLAGRVEQNDPALYEHLRWKASGNEQPDLTPNEVMFGNVPSAGGVTPEMVGGLIEDTL